MEQNDIKNKAVAHKQDNELIYIYKNRERYDADYISDVEAELIKRGISIDTIEPAELEEPPNRNRKISGWLTFFLYVGVGFGAFLSIVLSIINFSMSDYNLGLGNFMTMLGVAADVILLLGIVVLAIYTISSFYDYKPNAVALAKAYVIIIFSTNLITLFGGYDVKAIRGIIWGVIWFSYLYESKQVAEIFPVSSRKMYKADKFLIAGIVGPSLLFLIMVLIHVYVIY